MLFKLFRRPNEYKRNPQEYIKQKCDFLIKRGYKLEWDHINSDYWFRIFLKGPNFQNIFYIDVDEFGDGEVYFYYSNFEVKTKKDIWSLGIETPDSYTKMNNKEKIDYVLENLEKTVDKFDIQPKDKLNQAWNLSRENKHEQAFLIYEELYKDDSTPSNAFNLLICSVYCGKKDIEKELYEKLKDYSPNPIKNEQKELCGPFVKLYYGIALSENGRKEEAIQIIDYLIQIISHYKVTDPTFLYLRGIPAIEEIYSLIKATFDDKEKLKVYKKKLKRVADSNSRRIEFKD